MPLRWGIAGASRISHDFCTALRSGLTANGAHEVVAVASRSETNAREFARQHGISVQRAYGSYAALARDSNVEVVYVAVLNPQHYAVARLMILHGKHVVCEKPFAMNHGEAQHLVSLALEKRVFIMEGMWTRFFPVYRHLSRLIDMQRFGDIKEVYVKHGFQGGDAERIIKKDMGGGIVLDIGCYAIQLVLFAFREPPKSIKAEGKVNSDGVDLYFQAELQYSDGRVARIVCSGLEELENQATIITSKGPICIPTYWCPTQCVALGEIRQWGFGEHTAGQYHYKNSVGLKYEADEVYKCIRSGELHCSIMPPDETLAIAKIQDEIRRQIGVQYESDNGPPCV